jgi:hypothetical protein
MARNPYVYVSGVFAAAWAVAAWFRPEADFVVFPFLVAASFPLSYRLAMGPPPAPLAAGAASAGVINVVVVSLFLALAGILAPAQLIPAFGAVGEATFIGALGGVIGFVLSRLGADAAG